MKLRTLCFVAGAVALLGVGACSTWRFHSPETEPIRPAFRYGLEGPANSGVVQAFNFGATTYVQFLDLDRAHPVFSSAAGRELAFKVAGQYAVLDGVLDEVTVNTTFGLVRIYTLGTQHAEQVKPVAEAASSAASAASMPQPGLAASAPAAVPVAVPAPTAAAAPRPSLALMRTSFTFNHDQWSVQTLNREQLRELRSAAEVLKGYAETQVRVVGYADPVGRVDYNVRLSERRADAVASVLRNAGVGNVIAVGLGPQDPINDCTKVHGTVAVERCLAPSRRVVITLVS